MPEDITSAGIAESGVTVDGAAVTDGAYTLFVADFSDTDTAWAAYQELKSLEDGATAAIDGVIVVKRETDGALEVQKATDHSTRSGLKWGPGRVEVDDRTGGPFPVHQRDAVIVQHADQRGVTALLN